MKWKNLYIEKLVSGGLGLSRTESGIAFVSGVLPGETINGYQFRKTGGCPVIKAEEIVISSDKRIKPSCKYFNNCGACNWQYMDYDIQSLQKREIFTECMRRIGKIAELPEIEIFKSEPWNYRLRTQIKISKKSSGYFGGRTNTVVDIDKCMLLHEPLNRLFNTDVKFQRGIEQIKAIYGDKLSTDPVIPGLSDRETTIIVDNKAFLVPGKGFFQSNRYLLKELGTWAAEKISGEFCLDIYGGVGFFSILLNSCFKKGILIDNMRLQTKYAKKNLINNGIKHFKAVCADAGDYLKAGNFPKVDCIIVDPPRIGLTKTVRENIGKIKPRYILSVSCDSGTHARDIGYFKNVLQYEIKDIALFDLYPQTSHMETIALLEYTGTKTV